MPANAPLTSREAELIAIGAATTANCVPCLRYHLSRARTAGARDTEIQAAIDVGRTVRHGAVRNWDEEAKKLLQTNDVVSPEGSCNVSESDCCS